MSWHLTIITRSLYIIIFYVLSVKKEPPTTMPSTKAEEMTVVIETTEATTQLQNTETKTTTPSPVVYPSGEKSVNSEKIG